MLFDKMKWEIMRYSWEGGKDLLVASTTCTMGLPLWGGTGYLMRVFGRVVTAFSGITGPVTIEVGFDIKTDAIIAANDLSRVGELIGSGQVGSKGFCERREIFYDPPSPIVTFTSSSGNLEDLTAGRVELIVLHLMPK